MSDLGSDIGQAADWVGNGINQVGSAAGLGGIGADINSAGNTIGQGLSSLFQTESPTLGQLQQNGFTQSNFGQGPGLNMGAYGPQAAAQGAGVNQSQANQFLGGQQGLVAQLQAQAQGGGPNLAQQQLQQATQANLQSQAAAAAGARGNQNPGLIQRNIAQQGAATNQQAAGQAAQARGQQELAAQGQLSQALGAYGGQQIGLAENQAALSQQNAQLAQNQSQFNTQSAQAGNTAQQNQWQFGTGLAANQQNQANQDVYGLTSGQHSTGAGAIQSLIGGIGGAASSALGALAAAGDGALAIDGPEPRLIGEAGPEAVVPLEPHHLSKFLEQVHETIKQRPEMKDDLANALHEAAKAVKHG